MASGLIFTTLNMIARWRSIFTMLGSLVGWSLASTRPVSAIHYPSISMNILVTKGANLTVNHSLLMVGWATSRHMHIDTFLRILISSRVWVTKPARISSVLLCLVMLIMTKTVILSRHLLSKRCMHLLLTMLVVLLLLGGLNSMKRATTSVGVVVMDNEVGSLTHVFISNALLAPMMLAWTLRLIARVHWHLPMYNCLNF